MALTLEKRHAVLSLEQLQYSVSTSKYVEKRNKALNEFIICFFTVIYLTSSTAAAAKKQKHKSLSSDNVFSALEDIEFENFIEPLRDALETFRKVSKEKKSSKINDSKIDETSTADGEPHTEIDDSMNE